jgi:hypothetical protein
VPSHAATSVHVGPTHTLVLKVGPDSSRAVATAACMLAWLAACTCGCSANVHTGLCRRPATYRCRHVSRSSTASEVEITPYLISCKGRQAASQSACHQPPRLGALWVVQQC